MTYILLGGFEKNPNVSSRHVCRRIEHLQDQDSDPYFSTTYQKIGDLFCPVLFLDFRIVCVIGHQTLDWPIQLA